MDESKGPKSFAEQSIEEAIRAAATVICQAAFQLIEDDPHQFSKRPCSTCRSVSALIGRPFGCLRFAKLGGL